MIYEFYTYVYCEFDGRNTYDLEHYGIPVWNISQVKMLICTGDSEMSKATVCRAGRSVPPS